MCGRVTEDSCVRHRGGEDLREERREEAGVARSDGKIDGALCEAGEEKIQVITRG